MGSGAGAARAPQQQRSQITREKIAHAAVSLLGERGIAEITHRDIASRAKVPLAATTYYYQSKFDIVSDASSILLGSYLNDFRSFADRRRASPNRIMTLEQFSRRLVSNATVRDRTRTLAWCEIMIACARHAEMRPLARNWFAQVEEGWADIATLLGRDAGPEAVRAAIDTVGGLLFIVIPLGLSADQVAVALEEGLVAATTGDSEPQPPAGGPTPKSSDSPKARETRERLLNATISILMERGSAEVTSRTIAAETGLAPAAAPYHFGSIPLLLSAARQRLYETVKERYRTVMSEAHLRAPTMDQIVDLTTTIFLREVTEYRDASLASFSIEIEAARQRALRSMVQDAMTLQCATWEQLFSRLARPHRTADDLRATSLFIGKQIRILATGAETGELADVRSEFRYGLNAIVAGGSWV